jgi:hypothetical protein
VEDQIDEVASITDNDCKHSVERNLRLQRKTDAAKLGLRMPLWFRLLLRIPELPSALYLPAAVGLLCYSLLPMVIILGHLLAFVYIVSAVPFPWNYLCVAGVISPISIISLSTRAHVFWNYWKCVVTKNNLRELSIEQRIENYVALVSGKENA